MPSSTREVSFKIKKDRKGLEIEEYIYITELEHCGVEVEAERAQSSDTNGGVQTNNQRLLALRIAVGSTSTNGRKQIQVESTTLY